ncbi:MAG: ammonium transporter [Planctomycetota bacterium]|nr:ammonium transporter [Planctomycetota bacterium]
MKIAIGGLLSRRKGTWLGLAALACAASGLARGEEPAAPAVDTGDHAWMLISTALVLMMTAPGLALFYGGLVRQKNVLSTMMHSLFLMGLVSVLWAVYGYGMAFGKMDGTLGAYIGNPADHLLLKGVGGTPSGYAPTVPHTTFMLFQLMFAIITPALISGAYAERIKFSAMVAFTVLWLTVVYFPLAHMVWGEGGLFNWALGGKIPALDFAGGTVVHISAGFSALVCALVLGKRKGYPTTPMLPHNLVLSVIGAGLLWVGWFGFNAGSALGASSLGSGQNLAASAFAATHFASAAAALAWAGLEWIQRGKPSALGTVSGLVAGLVAVTPAAGFVSVGSALLIGLIAGTVCYVAVTKIKIALGYDDSLDAFGVHGVGGLLGALLTGLFADPAVNPLIADTFKPDGSNAVSLAGGMGQLANQALAAGITIALSVAATYVLLKVVDATIGLRASEEAEQQGLDLSMHGEEAYAPELGGGVGGASAVVAHSVSAVPTLVKPGA